MIHFSLYAVDDEALRIINDPRNASLKQPGPNGRPCFVIGDDHTSKSCGNLLSIGRNEETSDVYLGSSRYYSGTQCYIYVHPLSGEYVLRDKSGSKSTVLEVEGDHDKKYTLQGDPRRRVLPRGRSARICCRKATFHIWWPDAALPSEQLRVPQVNEVVERSTVERQSALPPPRETRVQPPKLPDGVQQLEKIDHEVRRNLGSGAFGQVKLTVDLDSGRLLAVKRISVPPENEKRAKQAAKTEVHLLAKLAHPHIAVFVHSQGWLRGEVVELFMTPYDGSLKALMRGLRGVPHFYEKLRSQMLDALDFLRRKQVVHCDIKPENILQNGGGENFYLSDFGLSNSLTNADTGRGTLTYMAPEAFQPGKLQYKSDIWSLGVTLLEVVATRPVPIDFGRNYNEYFQDPTKRAAYYRALGWVAFKERPELLRMLQIDLVDRYDAKDCILEFSGATKSERARQMSWEYPALELPDTTTTQTTISFDMTFNSRARDQVAPRPAITQHMHLRAEQPAMRPQGQPRLPPNHIRQPAPLQELRQLRNQPIEGQIPREQTPSPLAPQGKDPSNSQQPLAQEYRRQQPPQTSNKAFAYQIQTPSGNPTVQPQQADTPPPTPSNRVYTTALENQSVRGPSHKQQQEPAHAGNRVHPITIPDTQNPFFPPTNPAAENKQKLLAAGQWIRESRLLTPPPEDLDSLVPWE